MKAEESTEEAADATAEAAPEEGADEAEETVQAEEIKKDEAVEKIVPGMVVRVHVKIKDVTPKGEERERIQVFEGTVIARKGAKPETTTITVRKVSGGIGIERIFPLAMPSIDKIEVVKKYRTRQSKLYYLRTHKKKLKEEKTTGDAK